MYETLSQELKYELYEESVQDPQFDVELFDKIHADFNIESPALKLREDFCGTFWLSTKWIKSRPGRSAVGVDLAAEPTAHGKEKHLAKLSPEEQSKFELCQCDVRTAPSQNFDFIVALNFSYFCFKKRSELKAYFQNVYNSLKVDGLFVADVLGGTDQLEENVEENELELNNGQEFKYLWEQKNYNLINNHAEFAINFEYQNRIYNNVFTYDWRLWSLTELQDLLLEVGFRKVKIYMEEDDEEEEGGNGVFKAVESDESCETWIANIAALK